MTEGSTIGLDAFLGLCAASVIGEDLGRSNIHGGVLAVDNTGTYGDHYRDLPEEHVGPGLEVSDTSISCKHVVVLADICGLGLAHCPLQGCESDSAPS